MNSTKPRRIAALLIGLSFAVLTATASGRQIQANSCTSPGVQSPIPLIGAISQHWNCWLMDDVYRYLRARGFSEYFAATYANNVVTEDAIRRLNEALRDIRNWDPAAFDQKMTEKGLSFKPEE